ncbi:MAG: hypothetical protein H6733_11965 [Alphaproteobacteria bacterium]|nr:hypothetical protein [Alphaproteobacteria bacterium]
MPIALDSVLTLRWPDYLHALHVQMCSWQVHWYPDWPTARVSLDPRYDNAWVNALVTFRALHGRPLAGLTDDERQMLVGQVSTGRNLLFFGSLRRATHVTSTLLHPAADPRTATVIDDARRRARALPTHPPDMNAVLSPWSDIVALPGFGPATASRVLLAERPDYYVMLNNFSTRRLSTITGLDLPTTLMPASAGQHYRAILEAVYRAPWFQSAPPSDPWELDLWQGRAALLDVLAYEESPET